MQSSQASQSSQRSMPRRNPSSEPIQPSSHPPPSHPPQSNVSGAGFSQAQSTGRNSSGSAKAQSNRRTNPSQQLSQIEKSVTHLLVATKQLLETLTQWSRHTATEAEVSDVYVRLGYEFNIASRAFNAIGVETADLGNVPDLLRTILEDTLSQEASPTSLDRYLPRIRDIIINLLHGLKRKQAKLRQRQGKDGNSSSASLATSRQSSLGSFGSAEALVSDEPSGRYGSGSISQAMGRSSSKESNTIDDAVPPRKTSVPGGRASPVRQEPSTPTPSKARSSHNRESSVHRLPSHSSNSSMSSNTMQALPVVTPYPQGEKMPDHPKPPSELTAIPFPPPPPPPPPKPQEALAALQRGGDLERRASRRYSAYHISKHLGASPSGMPMLPPAQNSPIPNRGRDFRESMTAVRTRGSLLHNRQRSGNRIEIETSPSRAHEVSRRISEEPSEDGSIAGAKQSGQSQLAGSPIPKTPDDKLDPSAQYFDGGALTAASEALNGQVSEEVDKLPSDQEIRKPLPSPRKDPTEGAVQMPADYAAASSSSPESRHFVPEQSPQPGKELTMFLQYKSKIKKFVLPDGSNELSIARLQLAFIEKFAWNTHSNGNDLPEIYVQDPVSGVRHELEDLNDVKDRAVLVLNVEPLDEVKRHIDEGLGGLKKMVEGVRGVLDGQESTMQRVSDRQQDTAKEMARLAAAPAPGPNRVSQVPTPLPNGIPAGEQFKPSALVSANQLSEIQSLRRDLAVMRQTYSSFVSDIEASMSSIRTKAGSVKSVAITAAIPTLDGDSGRFYVNKGKKDLTDISDNLVNKVDDLQDLVEELRKDVVSRGVRPIPRQLESVGKEISNATAELKKIQELLTREKPKWNKIWQQELQVVCDDRDLLNMQEALAADLEDDLEGAAKTFALVEQATKEQLKDSQTQMPRSGSRGLTSISVDPTADPHTAKEGVLGEVRALQPNHENRLEAIERAEKMRQKELESRRGGAFQKELGSFVGEGRLKKSGGVEEAERMRLARDEQARREVWERQNARAKEKEAKANAVGEENTQTPNEVAPQQEGQEPSHESPEEAKEDGEELRATATATATA
ncbi:MAG: Bud site selection protein 6 [Sclerophora amabilis]|nr:MAG: Bud site selection protein 6 [Sclerophora amabilis]